MNEDNIPLTAEDLAEAMQYSLTPQGRNLDPHASALIFAEQTRRAQIAMDAAGPVAPAPSAQSVGGPQPDQKAWDELSALASTKNPRTNQPYKDDLGREGQTLREMLDGQRRAVFAGQPLDAALIQQVKRAIVADAAAYATEQAKADADLVEKHKRGGA